MSSLPDGLRLAVGTLTALRIPPPRRVDRSTARAAMLVAPVAVLPLGVAAAAAGGLHQGIGLSPLVAAGLAMAVVAWGSRGLHLDGLADTADGLGSGYDRERSLEIMRRGNTGPMGVAAVVLVLLIQVAGAAALLARPWGFVALGVLVCLSRTALVIACAAGVPPARPSGLGATVAGVGPRPAAAGVRGRAAGVAAAPTSPTGSPWWLGVLGVAGAAAVVAGLVVRCVRRFGGITGDVLGASIEVALLALLVVGAR
ncbi:adenosylcobinamide-GDP ribazoletransferase [Nakamurella sp.]|uniref:adenosylcobinamide-GDP ribazoletransferase n=1 Tax=Nakamurella sp. TaxID=1869182 RepID=UPI003B3B615B